MGTNNKEIIMQTLNKNNKYITIYGDIFENAFRRINEKNVGSSVIIPHVCNNVDLFGAGFAAKVAEQFPSVKENYHMLGKTFLKNNLGHSQFIKVFEEPKYKHKLYIVNMIAQNGIKNNSNPRPLNYAALVKCMININQFISQNQDFSTKTEQVEIHSPKFGSGLSGGNWNFISDLIEDIWNKYSVFVYEHRYNHDTKK
jgi:hypothetical protein